MKNKTKTEIERKLFYMSWPSKEHKHIKQNYYCINPWTLGSQQYHGPFTPLYDDTRQL